MMLKILPWMSKSYKKTVQETVTREQEENYKVGKVQLERFVQDSKREQIKDFGGDLREDTMKIADCLNAAKQEREGESNCDRLCMQSPQETVTEVWFAVHLAHKKLGTRYFVSIQLNFG